MAAIDDRIPGARPTPVRDRLAGLDGVRGLAALFVVLHHCWLLSFPGYPANTGPWWTTWLVYGHFAVVVFIVLSGFSLAVSPARNGWQLGSLRRFAHRRAWRILPPYWAALVFSLVIAWTLVPQPQEGPPTVRSVVVYGFLVQDLFGAPSPNGAFWSIAIEAQLYLVFPLMLLVFRRAGALVMLGAVAAMVGTIGVLAPNVAIVGELMRLTPQFALLFAFGAVAAGVVTGQGGRIPLPLLSVAAVAPVIVLIVVRGSEWTVGHYFWVDLALGPAVALLLAGIATGRPTGLVRLLDTRPVRSLGSFSYSLYLTHAPIVVAVSQLLVTPAVGSGLPALLLTLAVAVPLALVVGRCFASLFELPFQRYRTWPALRAALGNGPCAVLLRTRRPRPVSSAEEAVTGQVEPPNTSR